MTTLTEMVAVQRDLVIDTLLAGNPVAWVDGGFGYRDHPFLGRPTSRSEIRPVIALPGSESHDWTVADLSDVILVRRGQRQKSAWTRDEIVERLAIARGFIDLDSEWLRRFLRGSIWDAAHAPPPRPSRPGVIAGSIPRGAQMLGNVIPVEAARRLLRGVRRG